MRHDDDLPVGFKHDPDGSEYHLNAANFGEQFPEPDMLDPHTLDDPAPP